MVDKRWSEGLVSRLVSVFVQIPPSKSIDSRHWAIGKEIRSQVKRLIAKKDLLGVKESLDNQMVKARTWLEYERC